MAKETTIIFVYDTEKLQREEDDPSSAILYFHPTWVSDQQKSSLCGQIVGTLQCIKNVLARPKIISLQTGKFYVIEDNRFLLALGTDRNITDLLLEHRANTVYSLLKFFHNDLQSLADLYTGEGLPAKLYYIFETYLKMLGFGGNIFSHIPVLNIPKSASNVYVEAMHMLECYQEYEDVLGGVMLYHNKVVATQLSADLTKRIILTDPYRIKCPAETVEANYELPLGVQLLQVYISSKEYDTLVEVSNRHRLAFLSLCSKDIKKGIHKPSQQDMPVVSAMKRDQSLIFTAVPEEDPDHSSETSDRPFIPTAKKIRPKFLNLKSISIDEASERKVKQVCTPLCGQTSVCSTPMMELKRIVHQNPLTICRNEDLNGECNNLNGDNQISIMEEFELRKLVPYLTVTLNKTLEKKYTSLTDMKDIMGSISKDALQYFSIRIKHFVDVESPKRDIQRRRLKSIGDPTFPAFTNNGLAVSRSYYYDFINRDIELVQKDIKKKQTARVKMNSIVKSESNNCFAVNFEIGRENMSSKKDDKICANNVNPVLAKADKDIRKSLTLPLKSLSLNSEGVIETPLPRRCSSGVQLTPLLSKLSLVAFEDRSSGFCSRETTPCDYRGFTPTQSKTFSYGRLTKDTNTKKQNDNALHKCVLFVCGQQDVVLTILLKEEGCEEDTVVKKLWNACIEHFGKLEKQLAYSIETQSSATSAGRDGEPYSFLCLDPEWDATKRGGPWGANDAGALVVLNRLHRDFNKSVDELTELLVRCGDSVIYGHNCGSAEIYYQEPAAASSGLPPPGDTMGLIQLKARRRLERDHGLMLL